jgi:hypothetical protein
VEGDSSPGHTPRWMRSVPNYDGTPKELRQAVLRVGPAIGGIEARIMLGTRCAIGEPMLKDQLCPPKV